MALNEARNLLKKYDKDGDKKISLEELGALMRDLDPRNFGDSRKVKVLYDQIDTDGNGQVDLIEFAEWVLDGKKTAVRETEKGEEENDVLGDGSGDVPKWALALPSYWNASGGSCTLASVGADVISAIQRAIDFSWRDVSTRDRKASNEMPNGLKILSVQRVENPEMWRRYAEFRFRCGKKHGRGCIPVEKVAGEPLETLLEGSILASRMYDSVNEAYLFHGTSPAGARGIAEVGFRFDLAGSSAGTMYGIGAYLAECSSKSDEYCECDEDGVCYFLLCRATLGQILHLTTGGESVHPMIQSAVSSGAYDSVLGDREAARGTYKEFVAYAPEQVYPEYIIKYYRLYGDDRVVERFLYECAAKGKMWRTIFGELRKGRSCRTKPELIHAFKLRTNESIYQALDSQEMKMLCKEFGKGDPQAMIEQADNFGDGTVIIKDFFLVMGGPTNDTAWAKAIMKWNELATSVARKHGLALDSLNKLTILFSHINISQTGRISCQDLMKVKGEDMSPEEVQGLIDYADLTGDGDVNEYSFLSILLMHPKMVRALRKT